VIRRTLGAAFILFGVQGNAFAQNSSVLKSVSKYLPSLTEIGFVTGAINCYVQTATLVRAVNKEIALAKSMSKRLDDLKSETDQMLGRFGSLAQIDPYNMDSWAAWLDRAQGLVNEETSDFLDILFNSVLKTLDERMTVGFYANIKKGLSYDASQGQVRDVLRAYYMDREYEGNRDKIRTVTLNSRKVILLFNRNELADVQAMLKQDLPPAEKKALQMRASMLEAQITQIEQDMLDPALGGTSTDRQIAFLLDIAQNIGQELGKAGDKMERHKKDLEGLNKEWELAAKDRLPKVKNRSVQSQPINAARPIYDPIKPDKVPAPINDVDKPEKQNTSETSAATSISDLLHLQNKISFKELEISESLLEMDLVIAQGRAVMLSMEAARQESGRNQRQNVIFGMGNLSRALYH
jgi:hypothetical protein